MGAIAPPLDPPLTLAVFGINIAINTLTNASHCQNNQCQVSSLDNTHVCASCNAIQCETTTTSTSPAVQTVICTSSLWRQPRPAHLPLSNRSSVRHLSVSCNHTAEKVKQFNQSSAV